MHVVFIEPSFPADQRNFVRGLRHAGAIVTGVGERPREALDPEVAQALHHYEQVSTVVDAGRLATGVARAHARLPVDRLEATVEAHVLAAAQLREEMGIPGTTVRTAWLCRDKPAMKRVLREGGVATAASLGGGSVDEALAFAERVGYPVIVKPRAGAGASDTERVDSVDELRVALARAGVGAGGDVAIEEFVEGHEGFYDTLSIGGRVIHDFVSHYYPNVLEAMRARWISPQIVTTNRIDTGAGYGEVRALGQRVNELLGIDTSATHMEWFFGPRGLRFSEVGCRPPGVGAWDLHAIANEIDLHAEWGRAVAHGRVGSRLSRRYAAGLIALRPDRDGEVTHCEGVAEVQRRFGRWVIDAHLPARGTPTAPIERGYMANGWVRMRHPDYDELRTMLSAVGEIMQLRAS